MNRCWPLIFGAMLAACAADSNTPLDLSGAGLIQTTPDAYDGAVGVPYGNGTGVTFSVANSSPQTLYYWTVTGSVPGLIFAPPTNTTATNSLLLVGTPLIAGQFAIQITVHTSDHTLLIPSFPFTITIAGDSGSPPVVTPLSLTWFVGQPYQETLSASGGKTPYASWSISGNPSWISLNSADGTISGTPTAEGASSFSVTVTDGAGRQATGNVDLQVISLNFAQQAGTWTGIINGGLQAGKRLSLLLDTAGKAQQATLGPTILATATTPIQFAMEPRGMGTNIGAPLSWHLVCAPAGTGDLTCTGHLTSVGSNGQLDGTVTLTRVNGNSQDSTPPTVTSSTPANGQTVGTIPQDVSVVFSELIAGAPLSAISLSGAGTPTVTGANFVDTGTGVNGRTLRIQVAGLLVNSSYTLTLNPAGQPGLIDLAGNPLATATITFSTGASSGNQPPAAIPQSYTVVQGTSISIVLTGSDPEGGALTYQVVAGSGPSAGALTGTAPNLTYAAPATAGADSFAFTVKDPAGNTSAQATISITILAANQPPIAYPDTIGVPQDTATAITLFAADPEAGTLLYTAATLPSNGTLVGTGGVRTYTPNPGYVGPDQFSFTVTDTAGAVSSAATVSINVVAAGNRPPVANPQTFTLIKRQPTTQPLYKSQHAITLTGTDPDGDALTFRITRFPVYQDPAQNMNLVINRQYQFVDPVTGLLTLAIATTGSTVTGQAPSAPVPGPGTIVVTPQGAPYVVVYTPPLCHTSFGQDSFDFVAIDSNGLRSLPTTVTMNENQNLLCNH